MTVVLGTGIFSKSRLVRRPAMVGAAVVLVQVVETLPPPLLLECCWKYGCAWDGFVSVVADVVVNGIAAEVLNRVEAVEEESRSRARRAVVVGES